MKNQIDPLVLKLLMGLINDRLLYRFLKRNPHYKLPYILAKLKLKDLYD